MKVSLELLRSLGEISAVDQHFARSMVRLAGEGSPDVEVAAAMASRQLRSGHVGWDIHRWTETRANLSDEVTLDWPDTGEWLHKIASSPLVETVSGGDSVSLQGSTPLVLDSAGRLYLRRYWEYQSRLATAIRDRMAFRFEPEEIDSVCLEAGLSRLFPDSGPEDLQYRGARAAIGSRFCVLSGGPGTGKTSTVGRILVLIVEQARARGLEPPRIQLAAPTGKAAAHLSFSLQRTLSELEVEDAVRNAIPSAAATLHRSLGVMGGVGSRFRHGADSLLPLDVMLVDEASMVDLAMMTRLVEAVPKEARLILLGDRDQLASVEAGAVLGDIARPSSPRDSADAIVQLTHSYRFSAESGVGRLTRAVNAGEVEDALGVLEDAEVPEVNWLELGGDDHLPTHLASLVRDGFSSFVEASRPEAKLEAFDRFRVLTALRHGPLGVEALNSMIEHELFAQMGFDPKEPFYEGRPLGMTRNDYELELYNGDVGLVVNSPRDGRGGGRALFRSPEGDSRLISTLRLESAETVFAMSIHKSQGSEFNEVVVVLPDEEAGLLTRELIYTAVSRAREKVTLLARREVLQAAIGRRIERASGLSDALWGAKVDS